MSFLVAEDPALPPRRAWAGRNWGEGRAGRLGIPCADCLRVARSYGVDIIAALCPIEIFAPFVST
jgi:hypothetical protein